MIEFINNLCTQPLSLSSIGFAICLPVFIFIAWVLLTYFNDEIPVLRGWPTLSYNIEKIYSVTYLPITGTIFLISLKMLKIIDWSWIYITILFWGPFLPLHLFCMFFWLVFGPYDFYLTRKKQKMEYEKYGIQVPHELLALVNQDLVQVKHPISGHYVKFYRSRGQFLKHKSSSGPYNRIPIIKECDGSA